MCLNFAVYFPLLHYHLPSRHYLIPLLYREQINALTHFSSRELELPILTVVEVLNALTAEVLSE